MKLQSIVCAALLAAWCADAAEIKGAAYYDGAVPKLRPLSMNADPKCVEHYEEEAPPPNEVLVLGEGQSLGNVMVEIIAGLPDSADYPVPTEPVVLTQAGCRYQPRVFGVRAGQPLKIRNPDGTLHNVNCAPKKNPAFNRGMPPNVTDIEVTFEHAEDLFPFRCNVHPWMLAHCAVLDHPFFDVTSAEADGAFLIADLPAGTYTVRATHERLGSQEQEVTVSEDGAADLEFRFQRPGAR